MKQSIILVILMSSILAAGGAYTQKDAPIVTGPRVHKNLAIFLIHGANTVDAAKFLTLEEALARKKVTVHETENVNSLAVTNGSADHVIFIMSGDIVKGGKQDRVIQYNYLVPPRVKKMPVSAFCVESGRWERRGGESAARFSSSSEMIASKDLKMSVRKEKSQAGVWSKVAEMQESLEKNMGAPVRGQSETSLQLTLEHRKVKEAQREYERALAGIAKDGRDVIGYACVINGRINGAEVFASHALFVKLWPKLARASIVEAISCYDDGASHAMISAGDVKKFLEASERSAAVSRENVSRRTELVEKEGDASIYYETRDADNRGSWINKSYMAK